MSLSPPVVISPDFSPSTPTAPTVIGGDYNPSPGTAASVVIGEDDAAILATAKTAGAAGNDLSVEVVIVPDSVELSVAEVAGKTTVRGGNKHTMIVTVDFGAGLTTYYLTNQGGLTWRTNSGTVVQMAVSGETNWIIGTTGSAYFFIPKTQPFPDMEDWSSAFANTPATGTPSVAATPATAGQAIALSQDDIPVALTLVGDGSASLAAVTETSLADGSGLAAPASIGTDYTPATPSPPPIIGT